MVTLQVVIRMTWSARSCARANSLWAACAAMLGRGVMLAIAADRVYARRGIVLNSHYRTTGNVCSSESWTYTLPRRVGPELAHMADEFFGPDARCRQARHQFVRNLPTTAQVDSGPAQRRALPHECHPRWPRRSPGTCPSYRREEA
jgi:hypothetical protein